MAGDSADSSRRWPPGAGEAADLVRRIDWTATPLGPPSGWPACLRTTVETVLRSKSPMLALWGADLLQFYNDGYRAVLADRHPAAMGRPNAESAPEEWPVNEPVFRRVMQAGQTVHIEDEPVAPDAQRPAARWRTACHAPIRDAEGTVRGVLVTLLDTTRRAWADQRNARLLARSRIALNHLSQLFEQAPGFAAVLRGPGHVFEMANDALYQLVGRRELVGRPLLETLPELEQIGIGAMLDEVLQTGRPHVGRSTRIALSGSPGSAPVESWIDFVFQPLIESDGTISGVFVQGHDVSERRLAEDALRERNQRLGVLYDTARAMLAAEQPIDFLDRIYGRLADLLGLDVYLHHGCAEDGSHLGLTAYRGLTAEQAARLGRVEFGETVCGLVASTREPIVADDVMHSPDRRLDTIRSLGLRAFACEPLVARGQLVGTLSLGSTMRDQLDDNSLGTIRAISQLVAVAIERQRTRQALRDSEERFRSVFSHAAVGIAVTDPDGRFLHANDALCRLLGRSEEDLRSLDNTALTHPEDRERYREAARQVLAGESPSALVQTRYLRGSRIVWVQASIAAVRDDRGRAQSLISLVEDVSERMLAENRLARADRTRSEFLAMLAHELRNPMAPLRNAIALMERGDPAGRYTPALVAIMHRQVDQLSRLVGDLLEVSRINQGKIELRIEPMALSQALGSAVEAVLPLVEERRQKLIVDRHETSAWIDGDSCRIAQVVTNLLHNAVKFTPEGGRIELSVDDHDPDQVTVVVRDHGVGIGADLLPHVFELFEQGQQTLDRSQGGLGIGLALVRRLVHMHGGTVAVQSEGIGRGATFAVRLPRRLDVAASAAAQGGGSAAAG
jgi:PAS domain S-box-containing protein